MIENLSQGFCVKRAGCFRKKMLCYSGDTNTGCSRKIQYNREIVYVHAKSRCINCIEEPAKGIIVTL